MGANAKESASAQDDINALDPVGLAKNDCKNDLIRRDMAGPTGNQRLIQSAYEAKAREFRQKTEEQLARYADLRSSIDVRHFRAELSHLPQNSIEDFESVLRGTSKELGDLAAAWSLAATNMRRFKVDNNLNRDPVMPKNKWLHRGFMAAIILGESALNSEFFAAGSESGLVGGIIVSLILSGLNFMLAIGLGVPGVRNINHVQNKRRNLGLLAVAGWIVITLIINLAAAHYRMNISIDPLAAARDAFFSFIGNPLEIPDLKSWALFIMGLGANSAMAAKQLKHEDIYPGFVKYGQTLGDAKDDFVHARERMIALVPEHIEAYKGKADEIHERAKKALSDYRSLLTQSKNMIQNYPEQATKVQDEFSLALEQYRDAVREWSESKANVPDFFRDTVKLDELDVPLDHDPLGTDEGRIEPMRKDLGELNSQIVKVKQSVQATFKPTMDRTVDYLDDLLSEAFGHSMKGEVPSSETQPKTETVIAGSDA